MTLAVKMRRLDQQLARYESELRRDVFLRSDECGKVATLVAADVRFLPSEVKDEIRVASPVPLTARYDELVAFQAWNDFAASIKSRPEVTRAQVIVQDYICFAYLKDACFEVIAAKAMSESVAARCAKFLTSGAVRDFRNAFAHANWCYKPDYSGLKCWVLEDARKKSGSLRSFEVSQHSLNFWQALSRGIAYATYEQVAG
ncbi:MAG: hypothetical protein HY706_18915 [Candidatus Hydrogenedentes bacterium]|nr:hypothetical protein [Candidatus Hydrogenedentota bacterium]